MSKEDWIILENNEHALSYSDTSSHDTNSDSDDIKSTPGNIKIDIEPPSTTYQSNISDIETIDYESDSDNYRKNDDDNRNKSRKIMAYIFVTGCLYITFIVTMPNIYTYFS